MAPNERAKFAVLAKKRGPGSMAESAPGESKLCTTMEEARTLLRKLEQQYPSQAFVIVEIVSKSQRPAE